MNVSHFTGATGGPDEPSDAPDTAGPDRGNEETQGERMSTDAMTLKRLSTGQSASFEQRFEQLFQQHYARVYRILYRLVGDEADDLAQEVFLRLYRNPPQEQKQGVANG